MEKLCRSCGETKPFSEFHKQAKAKDGLQFRCKTCDKVWHGKRYLKDKEKINVQTKAWKAANKERALQTGNEWRKNNPEKVRKYQRTTNLRKNFGLEVEQYEKMLQEQDGKCAICKQLRLTSTQRLMRLRGWRSITVTLKAMCGSSSVKPATTV